MPDTETIVYIGIGIGVALFLLWRRARQIGWRKAFGEGKWHGPEG